ncbi:hypothetical protein SAMN04487914_1647 [Arthrobacter sp. ok909]|nr:hypothetical protein SAMN04487914_1647 [Arthrobacter sp. ok909]
MNIYVRNLGPYILNVVNMLETFRSTFTTAHTAPGDANVLHLGSMTSLMSKGTAPIRGKVGSQCLPVVTA